jgi:hypothetical protein
VIYIATKRLETTKIKKGIFERNIRLFFISSDVGSTEDFHAMRRNK